MVGQSFLGLGSLGLVVYIGNPQRRIESHHTVAERRIVDSFSEPLAVVVVVACGYSGAKRVLDLDLDLAQLVFLVAPVDCLRIVFHRPSQLERMEAHHSTHETFFYLGLEAIFALSPRGLGIVGCVFVDMAQRQF